MSGPGGAAPPTAFLGGRWNCGSVRRNTCLLSGSVQPGFRSRAPLRLPCLVAAAKGPRRWSSMTRFSLSEPSLLTPGQNVSSAGCSGARRSSVLQTRPPPPPSTSKPSTLMICGNFSRQHQQNQHLYGCSRPAYIHFSQAIRPSVRPRPVRRPSHNPALGAEKLHGDLQRRDSSSSQGEALSVVGKPCFLSCSQRPADSAGPSGRAQLHVFLPSEAEAEEGDGEPVDEGFMDEPDCSATSLKLQHKVPQTLADDI